MDAATATDLPEGFPADFPLPPGTVVTGAETRSEGRLVVTSVTPAKVKAALHFLQREMPAAGFRLTEGDVEEHDAESDWVGNGYRGRWAIRTIPGCGGDTLVTVLAQRTS